MQTPRGKHPVPLALRGTLADNLYAARMAAGLTQKALADLAGVSREYISYIENQEANVSIDVLNSLASPLNLSPSELLQPRLRKNN